MNTIATRALALLLLSGTSYGQVPAGNDTSDGNFNTGSGKYALGGPAAQNSGNGNTATGYYALFENTGNDNTASGDLSLYSNTGSENTAIGNLAMNSNEGGGNNTATGSNALASNISGNDNTATGYLALGSSNATGNTADGAFAMLDNSSGEQNTAVGFTALRSAFVNGVGIGTGSYNTAVGAGALYSYSSGGNNSAVGFDALYTNTTAINNTAFGYQALYSNNGNGNAAQGTFALFNNTSGIRNLGLGNNALYGNTTGSYNVGLGFEAGYNLTSGSNNIDIGNEGVAADNATIRIGTQGTQSATYIAGIENAQVTGAAVYVTASGRLGVLASSERYKTAIAPMGEATGKLDELRPVSFHLKFDPAGAVQYGLIAEEVEKIYPELVIRDAQGRIQGVRYDELAPMLLNELQRQAAKIDHQAVEIDQLKNERQAVHAIQDELALVRAQLQELQSLSHVRQQVAQR